MTTRTCGHGAVSGHDDPAGARRREVSATARAVASAAGHPLDAATDDDILRGLLRLRAAVARAATSRRAAPG